MLQTKTGFIFLHSHDLMSKSDALMLIKQQSQLKAKAVGLYHNQESPVRCNDVNATLISYYKLSEIG